MKIKIKKGNLYVWTWKSCQQEKNELVSEQHWVWTKYPHRKINHIHPPSFTCPSYRMDCFQNNICLQKDFKVASLFSPPWLVSTAFCPLLSSRGDFSSGYPFTMNLLIFFFHWKLILLAAERFVLWIQEVNMGSRASTQRNYFSKTHHSTLHLTHHSKGSTPERNEWWVCAVSSCIWWTQSENKKDSDGFLLE